MNVASLVTSQLSTSSGYPSPFSSLICICCIINKMVIPSHLKLILDKNSKVKSAVIVSLNLCLIFKQKLWSIPETYVIWTKQVLITQDDYTILLRNIVDTLHYTPSPPTRGVLRLLCEYHKNQTLTTHVTRSNSSNDRFMHTKIPISQREWAECEYTSGEEFNNQQKTKTKDQRFITNN